MAGIKIHFIPLLGFVGGVAAAFIATNKEGVSPATKFGQRDWVGGLYHAGRNVIDNAVLVLGIPVASVVVSGVAKEFGNPGLSFGKVSVRSF